MKQYFSIGEISKLFSIPIKTLRYYNEIGLLVPAYVSETKYRYYTIEQFIIIDMIQNAKLMGMSLDEIRRMTSQEYSLEEMVHLIQKQKSLFEKKIEELEKIKLSMSQIEKNIVETLEYEKNIPFIVQVPERFYQSFPYVSKTIDEQEVNLRTVIASLDNRKHETFAQFGIGISYDQFKYNRFMYGDAIRYYKNSQSGELSSIPKGDYLTIIFDDSSYHKQVYYEKLLHYIEEKKLKISGDFNEFWIMPRITADNTESTLVRLDIKVC